MATYSNQHWLLCHIRNSFISTDDTGMCETVMVSDDLPKSFLKKYQTTTPPADSTINNTQNANANPNSHHRKSLGGNSSSSGRVLDPPLHEIDFLYYPGLDQSDDEDMDLSTQSFDIQMYPEIGSHRFRSNTAQKLEKMDMARRLAARTKSVNYEDDVVLSERADFFVKKNISPPPQANTRQNDSLLENKASDTFVSVTPVLEKETEKEKEKEEQNNTAKNNENNTNGMKSKLALQLANSPKQAQNKFMEYARFDGTSQMGIQTKRINVFLNMLPEKERNYPIKICVLASAKIIEVIGLVCYKATIQYPDIPLKSIRHYALYMTEDNDDMEDFPPLDNREPCGKFGFSHLTLAERRPLVPVTRIDYHNNMATKSMTSEEDKARLAAAAIRSLQGIDLNGGASTADNDGNSSSVAASNVDDNLHEYEERMLNHNDMLEAPMYRTYRLHIIDKLSLKTEVTLGISGERIEIDHHKNAKFWMKPKAVTFPIDCIAFCEIVERRNIKATLRIWLRPPSSSSSSYTTRCTNVFCAGGEPKSTSFSGISSGGSASGSTSNVTPHSPTSPGGGSSSTNEYSQVSSPFAFFSSKNASGQQQQSHHSHVRFKHYLFEADAHSAEQIYNKLNCILNVRSSEVRREYLQLRERKLEKAQAKKQLKL